MDALSGVNLFGEINKDYIFLLIDFLVRLSNAWWVEGGTGREEKEIYDGESFKDKLKTYFC